MFDWLMSYLGYMHAGKLTSGAALDPAGLVAVAVAHGLALFVAVAIGANISGGHVNPAVTFGLTLGGQITILTGIFYWVAQLVGAIVASFLLKAVTGGLVIYTVHTHMHITNFSPNDMFHNYKIYVVHAGNSDAQFGCRSWGN